MAKASSNDILGVGKAFGIGSGSHPSVLKTHKTSQGASRSMAKASSNDILGLGKPLRSGQGAIRQFSNPIKPQKASRTSVLKHHKTSQGASRSMAKASSKDILGLGKPLRGAIRQF